MNHQMINKQNLVCCQAHLLLEGLLLEFQYAAVTGNTFKNIKSWTRILFLKTIAALVPFLFLSPPGQTRADESPRVSWILLKVSSR